MRRILAGGGIIVLLLIALAGGIGGWTREATPPPPKLLPIAAQPASLPIAPKRLLTAAELGVQGPVHPVPLEVLNTAAAHLHDEALRTFEGAPWNGPSRVGPVYWRVTRPWPVVAWSLAEDHDTRLPSLPKDLTWLHKDTLHTFRTGAARTPSSDKPADATAKHPKLEYRWEVQRVDLVGLLLHPEPVVYRSEMFVAEQQPEHFPTRPLDLFEQDGLAALRRGEDMYVRHREGVVHVLGAIRAKQECLKCHRDLQKGDLLGAFSYAVREAFYMDSFTDRMGWEQRNRYQPVSFNGGNPTGGFNIGGGFQLQGGFQFYGSIQGADGIPAQFSGNITRYPKTGSTFPGQQ